METISTESSKKASNKECSDSPSTCKRPSHMSVMSAANRSARVSDYEDCGEIESGDCLEDPLVFVSSCIPEGRVSGRRAFVRGDVSVWSE